MTVVPTRVYERSARRPVPPNVTVDEGLVPRPATPARRVASTPGLAIDPQALRWMGEELSTAVAVGAAGVYRLVTHLSEAADVRDLLRRAAPDRDAILCASTGDVGATALAMLKEREPARRAVARVHTEDLHPAHTPPYAPVQSRSLAALDRLFTTSAAGLRTLLAREPSLASRAEVAGLGVAAAPARAKRSDDGVLRLVTCSHVTAAKRLRLVMSALRKTERKIAWTHVGDGDGLQELADSCASLPANVQVRFAGRLANADVVALYRKEPVDVFVHVSESEGRPVSIFEALAHGIPVLAADAGGVAELVTPECGWLLPRDVPTASIAGQLAAIAALSPEEMNRRREAALARFHEVCDAERNYGAFADALLALSAR